MAKLYIATESFDTTVKGELAQVKGGMTIVREGHPLLKGREHLFKEVEAHFEVEKATAEPGEKRGSEKADSADTKEPTKTPAKKK